MFAVVLYWYDRGASAGGGEANGEVVNGCAVNHHQFEINSIRDGNWLRRSFVDHLPLSLTVLAGISERIAENSIHFGKCICEIDTKRK